MSQEEPMTVEPGISGTEKKEDILVVPTPVPKKRRKVPRVSKPFYRKLTLREGLMESQSELAHHMQALMLNILSDRRSIKYKAREQIAALELIARILGQMAPTEHAIMPIPPEQLKNRLDEIYKKIRGIQKEAPKTELLPAPSETGGSSSLSSLSTDQAFEEEVEVVEVADG